ncbi:hypothetical protein H9Q70_002787 [Fusarium xylarioides]|nr:hypothetical protein H9Q70_002787 [Fusarium xylarioides]
MSSWPLEGPHEGTQTGGEISTLLANDSTDTGNIDGVPEPLSPANDAAGTSNTDEPPRPLETTDSGADTVNTDEPIEPTEPTTGSIGEAPEPPEHEHEANPPPNITEHTAVGNVNDSSDFQ